MFDDENQINSGWINGGFFIFNKLKYLIFINKLNTMLERDTMATFNKEKNANCCF